MTELIKTFIEENIDYINENRWFLVLMSWYNNPRKDFPDTKQFDELIHVLKTVDPLILDHTEYYREGVIITITRGTIDDIKKNADMWARGKKISLNFLLTDLYSTLGLDKDNILACIQEAAKQEGLTYDSSEEVFTWE